MKIGILTGGGDCPGLNGTIRAVVRRSSRHGHSVTGIIDGWKGLIEERYRPLTVESTAGILSIGGTIIGTSRTNPLKEAGNKEKLVRHFNKSGFDALVAIGGDDTLGVASKLHQEVGMPVVGVPKTIDNDLAATDFTFGFDSAVNVAMEAMDRLQTTTASHHRVMVVEVMGRHAGWIAFYSGVIGSADVTLLPEREFNLGEVIQHIKSAYLSKHYAMVVVSEGVKLPETHAEVIKDVRQDEFGHAVLGGVGDVLAKLIEKEAGIQCRSVTLGYTLRGGSPTAFDRMLATRFGVAAADLVNQRDWGKMVALKGNDIITVPLAEAVATLKTVPPELYEVAETFFG